MAGGERTGRRTFLKAIGAGVAAAAAPRLAPAAGPARKPPNVVLIMTDDQGCGNLGCQGNREVRTPCLDRLHGQSVRLTDFHSAPTCAPTRAGLMTGRYCNRTGVWHTIAGRSLLRRDEVTMADVFAAGGYRTGIFGKWHLGDNFPFRPQDRGFQEVFVHGGGGVGQTPDYWGNKYFDDTYSRNGRPEKVSGYCTDVWFAAALAFIEASKDRPFFAYIPTNAAHGPHRVPEKYAAMYTGRSAAFYGMITNIDENVGRLMERLDALGLAEGTILVFLTDNGVSVGWDAGLRGTKSGPYEGGHRVPCFIRHPAGGLAGGRDVGRLASHVDLLPTLADLCGLAPPKGVRLDGTSLVPLLSGAADWPDRALVVDSQRIEHPQQWRNSCVMTDRWRLVNGKELYDIRADPGQREDVAAAHGAAVARLRAAYEAWWADTSKRFDEFCPIVLGSDREDPSRLTAHDWHAPNVPWNQPSILGGAAVNGFWAVEVERDGQYDLELRRWPAEADLAITAAPAGGKAVRATAARAKIGPFDETKPVEPGAKTVTFRAALKAGPARLETWLLDGDQAPRGAYYVYVRRRA